MLKLEKLNGEPFADIVDAALKGIDRFDTDWNNLQAADPGVTLVELLAWLKALQHEYLSAIRPGSQRRFLELLDIRQRRARGAKTVIALSGAGADIPVPAQTKWLAGDMVFENELPATAFAARLTGARFRSGERVIAADAAQQGGGPMFPGVPGRGPVPEREPREEMRLYFDRPIPSGCPFSLYIRVDEGEGRRTPVGGAAFFPLADTRWEVWTGAGWQAADLLRDDTHSFLSSGLVTLRHAGEMAPLDGAGFPVRVRLLRDDYDLPPRLERIDFNVLEVIQQDTLVRRDRFDGERELELKSDLGLRGGHRVFLERDGRWQETGDFQLERLPAEGRAVIRLPRPETALVLSFDRERLDGVTLGSGAGFSGQTLPFERRDLLWDSLELMVGRPGEEGCRFDVWQLRDDFFSSGPDDGHFTLDEKAGVLRFGDHIQGAVPPKGRDNILLAGCQTCRGKASEIKAGRIDAVRSAAAGLETVSVRQLLPAAGGRDGERFADTLARAGEALRSGDRAVTQADYARAVRAAPGLILENCRVLTGFDGPEDNRITVVVQGAGRAARTPREGYERNIRRALDRCRMLNAQIHVVWPRVVRLAVRGRIAAAPYYHDVQTLVRRRVEEFVAGLNRTFGSVLSYGELYCAVDLLDCVTRIESLSVEPMGDYIAKTRTDDIVVPPNSVYEIERVELSVTGGLL